MDREDLFSDDLKKTVSECNDLLQLLYQKNLYPSSWVGTIPYTSFLKTDQFSILKFFNGFFKNCRTDINQRIEESALIRGIEQRLDYNPIPGSIDDKRFPWFIYWEIAWVMKVTHGLLCPGIKILDAGGSSSLFTCYICSLGYEVHSVDLNEKLRENGDFIAHMMNWNMHSYTMNLENLSFTDNFFDYAYSICVFEHLDFDVKQKALSEIARCLKPGGLFCITFDYRNPAPGVYGYGKDARERNRLASFEDIIRNFLSSGHFSLISNQTFVDNGKPYLIHKEFGNTPYTFGAIILKKN